MAERPAEPIQPGHDYDVDPASVAPRQQLVECRTVGARTAHALVDELGHDRPTVSDGEVDALVPLARE